MENGRQLDQIVVKAVVCAAVAARQPIKTVAVKVSDRGYCAAVSLAQAKKMREIGEAGQARLVSVWRSKQAASKVQRNTRWR